ncbi:hypothetical protein F6455_18275 [Proteobacteria bacterium 005FR1]|nr:hypothetical protein [Proteobacteria bacterium 005FR1]
MADGTPDLQGIWTNVSLTTLTRRPFFDSLTITPEEAQRLAARQAARAEEDLKPTDPNAPPPEKGNNVGGYNNFWTDGGETLAMIDGQYRTSWIVDPADGQLPYSEAGRKRFESEQNEARNNYDGPEIRPMPERCIIGFGSTGGPPMMNVLYNNNYQIVQTADTVAILVEMNHDARIIRMKDQHRPESMPQWLGDSVGHWDGDTLVIETRNFNPGESLRLYFDQSFYISPEAVVTERLTRIADDEMFYEFIVDDPEIYTQPWRGEMIFKATEGPIYEYACHEGNYALPNILGGARAEEKGSPK